MKIRRVNLDLQKKHCSDASGTNKKNDYKEISSKRLKYCYQKKQKIPNAEITISHQFNDHQYFSVPKTSVNMTAISNTSNLLTKSHMKSAHNS